MLTAAVILNYNDSEESLAAAGRLSGYSCIGAAVLVDNASSAEEYRKLEAGAAELLAVFEKAGKRLLLIRSDHNGGYGSGNDLGVRHAAQALGAELCLIANPDSVFPEELVLEMRKAFEEDASLGVCGAVMAEGSPALLREIEASCWPERGFCGELLNSGPLCRRLFWRRLNYAEAHFREGLSARVFAVHGSLLMVRAEHFLSAGGYDGKMFLYCEENALAKRMKNAGFSTRIVLAPPYRHAGGGSIRKSAADAVTRERYRQQSELYYYETYLGAGRAQLFLARLFQAVVLLETAAAARLGLL